ncbi:PAS domain S-box protein [Dehalococcoides mccartyi]|uniref:PAS domain-containing sensor histidine kinase n=1 Tax=Dehalococcoides mccartyi TaxID=61435 RepID=UPI0026EE913F|nr:PAS domain S-box protein [Dehalococcoides mccartyi]
MYFKNESINTNKYLVTLFKIHQPQNPNSCDIIQCVRDSRFKSLQPNAKQFTIVNKLLLNDIRDYIFILDMDGKIMFVNEQACKARGYTQEELIGRSILELDTPETAALAFQKIQEAKEKGFALHNIAHKCKNGAIKISELLTRIVEIEGKEYVFGLAKDISEVQARVAAYVNAQEKEREWVSIEIHDRVIQNLTGISHKIDALSSAKESCVSKQIELKELSKQMQASIAEARNIMRELYPNTLARYGLIKLIQEELARLQDELNCNTSLNNSIVNLIPPYLETTIYRVFHEALLNIKKHSQASQVTVNLKETEINIFLEVCDNGVGFDAKNIDWSRPGGMESMRQRIEIVGGIFSIRSGLKGTRIRGLLPKTTQKVPLIALSNM